MLLTIQNIQKYFGAELCLRNISCVLDAQDRAGIIGENGAGKTTLIKIITGELYPDDGIVTLAHGATVGYLEQNSVLDPACTVYGEMENAFRSVLDAMDEMKRLERQMAECPGDHMLLERHAQLSAVVDAADGYNMDTQIKKILNGMAFPAPFGPAMTRRSPRFTSRSNPSTSLLPPSVTEIFFAVRISL